MFHIKLARLPIWKYFIVISIIMKRFGKLQLHCEFHFPKTDAQIYFQQLTDKLWNMNQLSVHHTEMREISIVILTEHKFFPNENHTQNKLSTRNFSWKKQRKFILREYFWRLMMRFPHFCDCWVFGQKLITK